MKKIANKKKKNQEQDINKLFEKLIAGRNKGIKNIEQIKRRITKKLDKEIKELYEKKDFIAEIWSRKEELSKKRVSVLRNIFANTFWRNIRLLISALFIYMMIIPAIFMHILMEIYHQVAFRLYDIPRVRIRDYFIFDRKSLPHLNWLEKFNCLYCSYFNNLIGYMREVGGRTERYWCPIKHAKRRKDEHGHYEKFIDYTDGDAFREKWDDLRKFEDEQE